MESENCRRLTSLVSRIATLSLDISCSC